MQPSILAVTGVSGFLGQRLLRRLNADPAVGRIVGLDVRDPARRTSKLEHHRVDIAGHDLKPLLEEVETLVHLAAVVDPIADDRLMARVNVEGTRRVLEAAADVGVRKLVRVSTAAAYGAWPTNPLPITEERPLRPNPGFGPALQAAETERLLRVWHDDHPGVVVTTLRAAPMLGSGATHLWSRLICAPGRLRVRGGEAPVQVVHVDDAVTAVELVVREDHAGVFNVACEGWLDADAVAALVPAPAMPAIPGDILRRGLARLWRSGIGELPPAVVPYLTYPWVIASDKLRAIGWEPAYSNEETILETLDARPSARVPAAKSIAIAAAASAAGLGAGLTARALRRRSG
ncbi:MAG TPA: NAD-dependent epimerase/dehydratase family protein [Acidimicrobiia bacterium]|jgi:UDP-glucose 4-epimerase